MKLVNKTKDTVSVVVINGVKQPIYPNKPINVKATDSLKYDGNFVVLEEIKELNSNGNPKPTSKVEKAETKQKNNQNNPKPTSKVEKAETKQKNNQNNPKPTSKVEKAETKK